MRLNFLLRRLVAALLVLAFVSPAAAVCRSASPADDGAMAGMSCCRKPAPTPTGSVEKDCCRMNERLPESTPAALLPPRASVSADHAPALVALPAPIHRDIARAHHDWLSARGRPHAPSHLLASVLLI